MAVTGWRTTLVVQGRSLAGALVPVTVGIVGTSNGDHLGVCLAGDIALLTAFEGEQLGDHVRAVIAALAKQSESELADMGAVSRDDC